MLRIDRKLSVYISMGLTVLMLAGTIALAFYLPSFFEYFNQFPAPQRPFLMISPFQRTFFYIAAYVVLALMAAGLGMLFALLMLVRKKSVFTRAAVELIRCISWCLIFIGLIICALTFCSFIAPFIGAAVLYLGLTIRVVKNVIEAAVSLKEENDLTV